MIFNGHGWLLEETASQQKSREYRKESQQSKFLHHHHHLGWDQQDDQSVMEHWFSAPVFSLFCCLVHLESWTGAVCVCLLWSPIHVKCIFSFFKDQYDVEGLSCGLITCSADACSSQFLFYCFIDYYAHFHSNSETLQSLV